MKFPEYVFGPGDKIKINVYKMDDFNAETKILPDGTINLPRIGKIRVADLTLNEMEQKLLVDYKKILKNPILFIDLVSFKPVRTTISGQVNQPGSYTLGMLRQNVISSDTKTNSFTINSEGWPTVIDAIQKAGGISNDADLTKIILKRNKSNSGKSQNIDINLWEFFEEGKNIENYYVFDGDNIFVGKANSISEDRRDFISKSNLSPSTIIINLVGEFRRPGSQKIKANSIPLAGILAGGGLTRDANLKDIRLLRLNDDGTLFEKKFKYKDLIENNKTKYLLKDRDVIVVNSSNWAKTKKNFNEITDPILRGASILNIFD